MGGMGERSYSQSRRWVMCEVQAESRIHVLPACFGGRVFSAELEPTTMKFTCLFSGTRVFVSGVGVRVGGAGEIAAVGVAVLAELPFRFLREYLLDLELLAGFSPPPPSRRQTAAVW